MNKTMYMDLILYINTDFNGTVNWIYFLFNCKLCFRKFSDSKLMWITTISIIMVNIGLHPKI
jgi:hypothetical protein